VDTIRIASWDFEVPRPCGPCRDYQRVVLSADFLSVDIDSDMSAVDECLQTRQKMDSKKKDATSSTNHSLGFHQIDSALHYRLIQLHTVRDKIST